MHSQHRQNLLDIFSDALKSVHGRDRVWGAIKNDPITLPTHLIAIGKAATAMAQGAIDALGSNIVDGLVITKKGYAQSFTDDLAQDSSWIIIEAGHPLPDKNSLAAGDALTAFIEPIPKNHFVLLLLSGGASALVERLPAGVGLDDWVGVNQWLLASGLDIHSCNWVRKTLSLIKDGRLAELFYPRLVRCLAISDVKGDDMSVIGSGLVVPSSRRVKRAKLPPFVEALVGKAPPAPDLDAACFMRINAHIIATLGDAKQSARRAAQEFGYSVIVHDEFIEGDATDASATLVGTLLSASPGSLHVWGGETTVKLPRSPGRGGRNQHLGLAAAILLQDQPNVMLLAAGTDGSDGLGKDAGALVDGETVKRGEATGLNALSCLQAADAGRFLQASRDLIATGPTGTNVMDMMIGLKYLAND
ncbi:MAG TPA: DUF4147 domain-containing protein [Acidiferrobacteraceae bacterium]|nr:DUF4147 domain-containing protein [Acidiferrobacteraceae bacterium]